MSYTEELVVKLREHERECLEDAARTREAISALEGAVGAMEAVAATRATPSVKRPRRRRRKDLAPEAVLEALRQIPDPAATTRTVAEALGVAPEVVLPKLKDLQQAGEISREGGATSPMWVA